MIQCPYGFDDRERALAIGTRRACPACWTFLGIVGGATLITLDFCLIYCYGINRLASRAQGLCLWLFAGISVFGKDAAIEQINLRAATGTGNNLHPEVIKHIHQTVMLGLSFVVGIDPVTHVPFNGLESLPHFGDVVRAQRILDHEVGNRIDVLPDDAAA